MQTCVDVANDVSDLVLRERLVDAAYEYGRCSFGVSLGYLTTEHGQSCASGKMSTFTFNGVEFTLTKLQHTNNMWKAAVSGRTRSKGLDGYSDVYDGTR